MTKVKIPAKPDALWTLAVECLDKVNWLKLVATGSWRYSPSADVCSPDGDRESLMDNTNCLRTDVAVGALLAKIGGSVAGRDDGTVFPVGSFCVVQFDPTKTGPLFLTMNDEPNGFDGNSGEIEVSIWDAP